MASKKKSKRGYLVKIDTTNQENELRDLLVNIVDERGFVSKYILEGHLLYTIGCDNIQMYNVIMNLTNNRELYSIKLDDGEYYRYFPRV